MSYSKLKHGIADALQRKMFALPLWGVLDISQMERRYEIIEVVEVMMFNDQFKSDGFKLALLDYNNFIQKLPYFHDEFIRTHALMSQGVPSYVAYLAHMNKKRNDYAKSI